MLLARRLPFFYGWVIVAITFICFAVGYCTWHSYSIFYVAILADTGWSRAETAAAFSVFSIVWGLNSPVAGALVDRFGPRRVMPLSALLLGAGLILTTRMSSPWQYYLLFGIVAAVGLSGIGSVPAFGVLSNWFVEKRGTASGLAAAGVGSGTVLLVPLLQVVIANHGWRTAYMALAAAIMLVVPTLTLLFQRQRPQEMGLLPDGRRTATRTGAALRQPVRVDRPHVDQKWTGRRWTLKSAIRPVRFCQLVGASVIEMVCLNTILTHQAAFFVDSGYEKLLAASVVGLVGIVGAGGQVLWGVVSDRIGREWSYTLAYAAGTAGIAILLSVRPGSPAGMLYLYGVVYGLAYGASAVLCPTIAGDIFQGKGFGAILGGVFAGRGLGGAMGAFLGGYIFDLTQSYAWAFMLVIPGMWLSCLLYWLAAPRKVRPVAGRLRLATSGPSEPELHL